MSRAIERRWYGRPGWLLWLTPLERLFALAAGRRRRRQTRRRVASPVPVIVVGNIAVGGTGKTPTLVELVKFLQDKGHRPGVVSRGYGRRGRELALAGPTADPLAIGDEPYLIYQATGCDVAVGSHRVDAIRRLVDRFGCDLILADDGLQHYKMARDAEIALVDGGRGFGNGHLLPVGPLREAPARLRACDWVLVNMPAGVSQAPAIAHRSVHQIRVAAVGVTHIASGARYGLDKLAQLKDITAVVGVGNPDRFFRTLDHLQVRYRPRVFPDHHRYAAADLRVDRGASVLMTEKDAVKCRQLAADNAYCLNIAMQLPRVFLDQFYHRVQALIESKKP